MTESFAEWQRDLSERSRHQSYLEQRQYADSRVRLYDVRWDQQTTQQENQTHNWVFYKGVWVIREQRHGLVLDTGAAANVSGDRALEKFESSVLVPIGQNIEYQESHQEFTGIAEQTPSAEREAWVPTYPGGCLLYTSDAADE